MTEIPSATDGHGRTDEVGQVVLLWYEGKSVATEDSDNGPGDANADEPVDELYERDSDDDYLSHNC